VEIETKIRQFIAQNLLFSEGEFVCDNQASFLQEGIIDSLGVMELVTFVSTTFGVAVDPLEVTPDNFDSVSKLASYIRRKTGQVKNECPANAAPGPYARPGIPPA
jgi:acyl carrier protein